MGPGLGEVVAEARRAAGLSQAELARRTGISASYLSRIEGAAWERGGPWPADGVLRALARTPGISSTRLMALRREARDRQAASPPTGHLPRANGRVPYAASVGPDEVDAAACGVVGRNPRRGTLRSVQVFLSGPAGNRPGNDRSRRSYLDTLGSVLADSPDAMLYRVCVTDPGHMDTARATVERLAGGRPPTEAGNIRTRFVYCNPLVLDLLIGDHEVLIAVPDRRGHPHLRAGIVVDDPDFVAGVRDWFDESVWHPPCEYDDVAPAPTTGSGAEQHLDPAGPRLVGPGADADVAEGRRQDVAAVGG